MYPAGPNAFFIRAGNRSRMPFIESNNRVRGVRPAGARHPISVRECSIGKAPRPTPQRSRLALSTQTPDRGLVLKALRSLFYGRSQYATSRSRTSNILRRGLLRNEKPLMRPAWSAEKTPGPNRRRVLSLRIGWPRPRLLCAVRTRTLLREFREQQHVRPRRRNRSRTGWRSAVRSARYDRSDPARRLDEIPGLALR
jgi:hypothetical protein